MNTNINKIGVLTSGGDAPGMNACIRAVVRAGLFYEKEMVGIWRGYQGMIEGAFMPMESKSVSYIINRGGSILKAGRSKEFLQKKGRKKAYEELKKEGIDAVVVIGGDGTFSGAYVFGQEFNMPVVGVPGTIDNDLYGTDFTLGYDTAINTAMEAIDKIRDTADAHDRLFFVEVMGRDAGFIALRTGIASGAKAILVPETATDIQYLVKRLETLRKKKKTSMIVLVAEGDDAGGAFEVAEKVGKEFKHYETRVVVLGHMQRGGSPTCGDRVLGSRLGVAAVEALLNGDRDIMVGAQHFDIKHTPLAKAIKHHTELNEHLQTIAHLLASV